MTKDQLDPAEQRLVLLIQALPFGIIERLSIRGGSAVFDVEPRIVQTIRLGSNSEHSLNSIKDGLPLKKEFEDLFNQLHGIQTGVFDIEIRHSLPFRLVLERRCSELVARENES